MPHQIPKEPPQPQHIATQQYISRDQMLAALQGACNGPAINNPSWTVHKVLEPWDMLLWLLLLPGLGCQAVPIQSGTGGCWPVMPIWKLWSLFAIAEHVIVAFFAEC